MGRMFFQRNAIPFEGWGSCVCVCPKYMQVVLNQLVGVVPSLCRQASYCTCVCVAVDCVDVCLVLVIHEYLLQGSVPL